MNEFNVEIYWQVILIYYKKMRNFRQSGCYILQKSLRLKRIKCILKEEEEEREIKSWQSNEGKEPNSLSLNTFHF